MSGQFEGKSVLITGASSGIGAALAREFASRGARVAAAARRTERLEALHAAIQAEGGEALVLACDVTDRASIDAAVATTVATFGGLDVLVANAGFGVSGAMTKLDTPDYRRQFDTNFFGVLDTVYAALPHLETSRGRIGLVGSVMGHLGMAASAPYCASKFAVTGLAECFGYDLMDKGISVTGIYPGLVASEIRSVDNDGAFTGRKDPAPRWLVMPVDKAAHQIANALYRRKPSCVITGHGKFAVFMKRHFPRTTHAILSALFRGRLDDVEKAKRGDTA